MKKILILIMISLLCGCTATQYNIDEQEKQNVHIPQNSYMLAGETLQTVEKSEHELADTVYYVKDEMDLAKVLQYNFNVGTLEVSYQAEKQLDIDKAASYMSFINPFDISLTQSIVDYTNVSGDVLYRSYSIQIANLDERFSEAEVAAKRIVKDIIHMDMKNDEKIEAIHDYIVETTVYDLENALTKDVSTSIFRAAGVLLDKNAVCTGYSRAFMLLAREANVPAIYISSSPINHGWNLVYGNNGWRYIDTTWDDRVPDIPGVASHQFLTMRLEDFLQEGSHVFEEQKDSNFFLDIARNFYN